MAYETQDMETKTPWQKSQDTAKWAVTMTKVRIRQAVSDKPWPHWHLLDFIGPGGCEAKGVVDLIAVRKDHGKPHPPTKRGDALQIILIQVKGGSAAKPTKDDAVRLRAVALRHGACAILLAVWKRGSAARFFSLDLNSDEGDEWVDVEDLRSVFG